jgi:hypothetical protein
MAAHTRVAVGYNVQAAVDVKHKLVVEQQVTNQVVDMGMLTQTAEPAKEVLGVETIGRDSTLRAAAAWPAMHMRSAPAAPMASSERSHGSGTKRC